MSKGMFFALGSIAGLAGIASADLMVTEAFVGLSGEDGTVDWIELTNMGMAPLNTGDFKYDDDSADPLDAGTLDSFVLAPGESAVFLISDDDGPSNDDDFTSALGEFAAIWGDVDNVGLTNGGGNLGQGGDEVVIFDAMDMIVASAVTPGDLSGELATIDFVSGAALSQVGVNGAYESNPFFNDNLGLPNDQATLIGSPGAIPAPGAFAAMGVAGVAASRRRR